MTENEPKLNKRERYKAKLRPIDYYEQFESLDFENLGEGDRFYLQDFGIFTTDFLEDEFTLRIRVPGGRLEAAQLLAVSDVVTEHDLTLILTARGGIQLHGLDPDNIREVYDRINGLGLTTWQSFGDNVRNIVTDVFDGCGTTGEIEAWPLVEGMQAFVLKNPRYVGMLPRRVSVGITGNRANVVSFYANDLAFVLAEKDGVKGFNVFMGGKNTEVAQPADIFLQPDEVVDFFKAFVEAFYKHGSRGSRAYTRLFYLIEKIGMDGLKAHIAQEYGREFTPAGTLLQEEKYFETYEPLSDGTWGYRYETDFGRADAEELAALARYAEENGAQVRLGIDQNIYLLGLKEKDAPPASPKPSATVLACAGAGNCPYSFWSIKDECSLYLPLEKIHRYRISVGFSGCAKGCGRHRHTDIGLIGLKTNHFGDTEGGARIFVGAEHHSGRSVGWQLFSMVPFEHLHDVIDALVTLFEQSGFDTFEQFAAGGLNRFSPSFVSMWMLLNFKTGQSLPLPIDRASEGAMDKEVALLEEAFGGETIPQNEKAFFDAIGALAKELWTVAGKDPTYKPPIERTVFR